MLKTDKIYKMVLKLILETKNIEKLITYFFVEKC